MEQTPLSCWTALTPLPFSLFTLSLLINLHPDILKPVQQIWVLIVDTAGLRKMAKLHSLAQREQSDRRVNRRRNLLLLYEEVYLVAEEASPA